MEIVGCIVCVLIIAIIYTMAIALVRTLACNDCPLKDKCQKSIENGSGRLCDENNPVNPLMPTQL